MWEFYKDAWTLWGATFGADKEPVFIAPVVVSGVLSLIGSIVFVADNEPPWGPAILAVIFLTTAGVALWPLLMLTAVGAGAWFILVEGVWFWALGPLWAWVGRRRARVGLPTATVISEGNDK